jgi:hypothetical protein
MQWVTVAIPPFESIEQFDKVSAQLGEPPDGLQARYFGTADDGQLRYVALWESKEHAERVFRRDARPHARKGARPRTGRQAGGYRDRGHTQLRSRAGRLNRRHRPQ